MFATSSCPVVCVFDPAADLVLTLETHSQHGTLEETSSASDDVTEEIDRHDMQSEERSVISTVEKKMTTPIAESQHIEMRVSSRHLALASPVFGNMIGTVCQSTAAAERTTEVPLQDDSHHALQILLNIVHGQHKKVPKEVETGTLWNAMALVDKYELHEITQLFVDKWFANLRPEFPRGPDQDIAVWIYICYGLSRSADFKALTKIAVLQTDCVFEAAHVARIPYWIIDQMRSCRQHLLAQILSTLSRLVELYMKPGHVCRRDVDCDALAIGKLIRGLRKAHLYPIPAPADVALSVIDLLATVRTLDLTGICNAPPRRRFKKYHNVSDDEDDHAPRCHMDEELRQVLSQVEYKFEGLSIDETSHTAADFTAEEAA